MDVCLYAADAQASDEGGKPPEWRRVVKKMWMTLALIILIFYVLNLRRQLREVSEEVSRLHKDFMAEVYMRYGEEFHGKE